MRETNEDVSRNSEGPPVGDESDAPQRHRRRKAPDEFGVDAGADEVASADLPIEQWLTRSWRPAVMLSLAAILLLVGALLPLLEAIVGHRLAFEPRWNLLPPQFWDFLMFSMGGYIGGRSLEKIAARLAK